MLQCGCADCRGVYMAFEDFLDHRCDIYHLKESSYKPNPALKDSKSYCYNDTPDISNQECHFGVKSMSISVNQEEPFNLLDGKIKLTLPFETIHLVNKNHRQNSAPAGGSC